MADSPEYLLKQAELAEHEAATSKLPNVRDRAREAAERWRMLAKQAEDLQQQRIRSEWYRANEASDKGG